MTKLRKKLGLYNFESEAAKWVERNIGADYVQEFLEKYESLNRGIPIGNYAETEVFLDMVERIRREI